MFLFNLVRTKVIPECGDVCVDQTLPLVTSGDDICIYHYVVIATQVTMPTVNELFLFYFH